MENLISFIQIFANAFSGFRLLTLVYRRKKACWYESMFETNLVFKNTLALGQSFEEKDTFIQARVVNGRANFSPSVLYCLPLYTRDPLVRNAYLG